MTLTQVGVIFFLKPEQDNCRELCSSPDDGVRVYSNDKELNLFNDWTKNMHTAQLKHFYYYCYKPLLAVGFIQIKG